MTDAEEMKALRRAAKLTQVEMAEHMGLAITAYQSLELGTSKFKPRHRLALETCSLKLAVKLKNIYLALPSVVSDAIVLVSMMELKEIESQTTARVERVLESVTREWAKDPTFWLYGSPTDPSEFVT